MITLLLIFAGTTVISAVSVLWVNLAHSPEGYEDASGFHVVAERKVVREARVANKSLPVHSTTAAVNVHLEAV